MRFRGVKSTVQDSSWAETDERGAMALGYGGITSIKDGHVYIAPAWAVAIYKVGAYLKLESHAIGQLLNHFNQGSDTVQIRDAVSAAVLLSGAAAAVDVPGLEESLAILTEEMLLRSRP